ncbi:MAG: hypothetical protein OER96_12420 [Gammaproteobacteria bacterium]|nr:hypothetical protein [Gammaproteobacteria bacterium]
MNEKNTTTELDVATKQALEVTEEKTIPGRFYAPNTDIIETDQALVLSMDMPGVNKSG